MSLRHSINRSRPEEPKLEHPCLHSAPSKNGGTGREPRVRPQGAQEQQHREVRQALYQLGYSRTRTSQLLAECSQFPPRNADQRERQTFEDQPQCIHDDSDIELTSTNDAPSIILILSQIAGASRLITDGPMHLLENNDLRTEFMRSKKIISNVYKKRHDITIGHSGLRHLLVQKDQWMQ